MDFKSTLACYLISFCIELSYVEFDPETVRNKEIAANSQVIEWRVSTHQKDDVGEYLKLCFPDVKDILIDEVIDKRII